MFVCVTVTRSHLAASYLGPFVHRRVITINVLYVPLLHCFYLFTVSTREKRGSLHWLVEVEVDVGIEEEEGILI